MQLGELTHTDLWGKYPVWSIHGNQYMHTFLDDATWWPRLRFLKTKDEAGQAMKYYITNLQTHGKIPKAI
jgi:hypothetical protein